MIRSGTTTFADHYFFPDAAADAAVAAGLRAVVGLPVVDFATRWAGTFDEYVARGKEVGGPFCGADVWRCLSGLRGGGWFGSAGRRMRRTVSLRST
jgi:hypothetical protein